MQRLFALLYAKQWRYNNCGGSKMSKKHLPVKGCEECEEFKTICVECLENETQDELEEQA